MGEGAKQSLAQNAADVPRGSRMAKVLFLQTLHRFPSRLAAAAVDAVEQRRIFVMFPFAFIAGLVAYRVLDEEPGWLGPLLGCMVIVTLIWAGRRSLLWMRLGLLIGLAWCGFVALPVHGALFGSPMLSAPKYGTYTARLDRILRDDGTQQRWLISEIATENVRDDPLVRRARLVVPGGVSAEPGDMIEARIRFYPVPPPVMPGAYDAQFVGYHAGIGAYGSILGDLSITPVEEGGVFRLIEQVRGAIAERIRAVLGDRIGGIAMALINGDQSRVAQEDWDTMALVGLAHVLSISGLHLTLAAGTMYVTLRFGLALFPDFTQRWPSKKIAAAGGILTAVAYMLISGMEVPAIRSTVMLILVFGAVLAGRQALTMRNVALAGLLLAALDPASVFRASYQLSFAAVVALIAAFETARHNRADRGGQRNRVLAIFIDATMTSLVAGAATLMFTAFHFQQTAPFGVVGNVLATPVVSFIMMPSALFAMLLLPFGLEGPLLIVMGWSIETMLVIAHFVGVMSGGYDPSPLLAPSSLVVCLVALAWLAFFETNIRLLGPALAVPIIFLFCMDRVPDVLVADSTQALAMRHGGELNLIAGRLNTFATNVWSERYMDPIIRNGTDLACDDLGCVVESDQGFRLALVRDSAAFAEDCVFADLVVTRLVAPDWCANTATAVDMHDLKRYGAHMLDWDAGTQRFSVRPAISDPDRPWRPAAQ